MSEIRFESYEVSVAVPALNCRVEPKQAAAIKTVIKEKEVYTISEEVLDSNNNSWGKVNELDGWIRLSFTERKPKIEEPKDEEIEGLEIEEIEINEESKVEENKKAKFKKNRKVHE